ncbi:50S ribosomal protein L5 [Candidatus Aerophobetes bacterium]|uniref:Large ribosomal subunit protein uL5 n=1 Tax=Aerophobetes bacterium TaxID=2030807 RepID=A0A2A4YML5_UNCAE|nr:MAG: 50S ribosomal protein L5 [Candidatus Aerophobetes bacterium]
MSELKKNYEKDVKDALMKKFSYENKMQIPALKKIIISMGVGEALKDKNAMQDAMKELTLLSGQKPIIMKAKNSISNFKLREEQEIGLKVTLRGKRMYDFMYRFTNIVSPRIRDFRGFRKKCDGRGNYSLGLDDQQVFPEVNLDEVKRDQGMNVTFVTSAQTDSECFELLKLMGMPYER